MPIIATILFMALVWGVYWFVRMDGHVWLEERFRAMRAAGKDAENRGRIAGSEKAQTLRSIDDPRDAAIVLMLVMARLRGDPPKEAFAAIEEEMRVVMGLEKQKDLTERLSYGRHVAAQVNEYDTALREFNGLIRSSLNEFERGDLVAMLGRIAEVEGEPTRDQQDALALTRQKLLD